MWRFAAARPAESRVSAALVAGAAWHPYIGWLTEDQVIMTTQEFFEQLDARIALHDLLCHPFYKAWSAGELSRDDLREYARNYYHHVKAFPTYLAELSVRLEEGELRRMVLSNLVDEKGWGDGAEGDRSTRNCGSILRKAWELAAT